MLNTPKTLNTPSHFNENVGIHSEVPYTAPSEAGSTVSFPSLDKRTATSIEPPNPAVHDAEGTRREEIIALAKQKDDYVAAYKYLREEALFTDEELKQVLYKNSQGAKELPQHTRARFVIIILACVYPELSKIFSNKELIEISSSKGGSNKLEGVFKHYDNLSKKLSKVNITRIIACDGGPLNLSKVAEKYDELIRLDGIKEEEIVSIASYANGHKNIDALLKYYNKLKEYGFSSVQMVSMLKRQHSHDYIEKICTHYKKHTLSIDNTTRTSLNEKLTTMSWKKLSAQEIIDVITTAQQEASIPKRTDAPPSSSGEKRVGITSVPVQNQNSIPKKADAPPTSSGKERVGITSVPVQQKTSIPTAPVNTLNVFQNVPLEVNVNQDWISPAVQSSMPAVPTEVDDWISLVMQPLTSAFPTENEMGVFDVGSVGTCPNPNPADETSSSLIITTSTTDLAQSETTDIPAAKRRKLNGDSNGAPSSPKSTTAPVPAPTPTQALIV